MKTLAVVLALVALPAIGGAEEIWRWKDAKGTPCYSNRPEAAPADATVVTTPIVIETTRLPEAAPDVADAPTVVVDAAETRAVPRAPRMRRHRIYTERRLRFDCYAGNILYAGGWSHPDDISGVGNCLPYLLGPEAWLNGARAELALREHGIDWRQLVRGYLADQRAAYGGHLTAAPATDADQVLPVRSRF